MATPLDMKYAQSASAHIEAARSAPHRAMLELNQAENFARLIQDQGLKQKVMQQVDEARKKGR